MSFEQFKESPGNEKMKIYHGISSTQRGGDAMAKLLKMIDTKVIYPSAENLEDKEGTEVDNISLAFFRHALSRGIKSGRINIDEYLTQNASDKELLSDPRIDRYVHDDEYRKLFQRFGLNVIDIDHMMRSSTTWTDENEEDTAGSYGDEIYLEIFQDSKDVLKSFADATVGVIVGPISFENVSRVVLSPKYASREREIRNLLDQKGLSSIEVNIK